MLEITKNNWYHWEFLVINKNAVRCVKCPISEQITNNMLLGI